MDPKTLFPNATVQGYCSDAQQMQNDLNYMAGLAGQLKPDLDMQSQSLAGLTYNGGTASDPSWWLPSVLPAVIPTDTGNVPWYQIPVQPVPMPYIPQPSYNPPAFIPIEPQPYTYPPIDWEGLQAALQTQRPKQPEPEPELEDTRPLPRRRRFRLENE